MQRLLSFPFLALFLSILFASSCRSSRHSSSEITGVTSTSEKVVSTARSYIGTKYKYGGMTRSGMDCSGLICTSFKSVNISLPRTSSDQSKSGEKINLDEVRPGDLLFFTDKKGHKKVTHVGLVSEARGGYNVRFIHSSTKLGVTESDLSAEYYREIFLFARRVLE